MDFCVKQGDEEKKPLSVDAGGGWDDLDTPENADEEGMGRRTFARKMVPKWQN